MPQEQRLHLSGAFIGYFGRDWDSDIDVSSITVEYSLDLNEIKATVILRRSDDTLCAETIELKRQQDKELLLSFLDLFMHYDKHEVSVERRLDDSRGS